MASKIDYNQKEWTYQRSSSPIKESHVRVVDDDDKYYYVFVVLVLSNCVHLFKLKISFKYFHRHKDRIGNKLLTCNKQMDII